jgi:hypothetical protein
MTPAAYHRQTNPEVVSRRFLNLASLMLLWSMPFLAASVCLDFYLIAYIIFNGSMWSVAWTIGLFVLFAILWFATPRLLPQPEAGLSGEDKSHQN